MKKAKLERQLKKVLHDKFVQGEEYQDKYFLMKKIQSVIPQIPDTLIYTTIDACNAELEHPIKSDEFIKIFLSKIFPILYEKI